MTLVKLAVAKYLKVSIKDIEQMVSDRTKYRAWGRIIKRLMRAYFEGIEVIFEQIEMKSRDPDFNRTFRMHDPKQVWNQTDFDDALLHFSQVKAAAWGIDPYDTAMKA